MKEKNFSIQFSFNGCKVKKRQLNLFDNMKLNLKTFIIGSKESFVEEKLGRN